MSQNQLVNQEGMLLNALKFDMPLAVRARTGEFPPGVAICGDGIIINFGEPSPDWVVQQVSSDTRRSFLLKYLKQLL